MSQLINALMPLRASGASTFGKVVSEFSPAEIRQTIAELVTRKDMALANALSDAGLSLYPHSEDILAIAALLAETQSDWPMAEQLLEQLIEVQGTWTSPMAWQHLIRVQRCHCEPSKALQSAQLALRSHPQDPDLIQELNALIEWTTDQTLLAAPQQQQ